MNKGQVRMAVNGRKPRANGKSLASDPILRTVSDSHASGAQAPLEHGELVRLMERLRDELNAFLDDVEIGHESSRNRDSSRGL